MVESTKIANILLPTASRAFLACAFDVCYGIEIIAGATLPPDAIINPLLNERGLTHPVVLDVFRKMQQDTSRKKTIRDLVNNLRGNIGNQIPTIKKALILGAEHGEKIYNLVYPLAEQVNKEQI